MQAVIMAGGLGTRLRPLTNDIPKPMVKIIDKPIIQCIIENLAKHGVRDIIVTLGYKPESITDFLGDGSQFGVRVRYSIEDSPLGTAGGVKNVQDMLEDTFVVMSGDALTDINISALLHRHFSHDGNVTMTVVETENVSSFGVVGEDTRGRVVDFVEKPQTLTAGLVNTGIYVMEKCVLDKIPYGQKYDFARDLFPQILGSIYTYHLEGYWSDIGTLSSYYLANNYVALHPQSFGWALID